MSAKSTRKENKMQFRPKILELLLKKQAGENREIPVAEIAKATELSKQTIYNWKNAQQFDNLDSDTAAALCNYFGVGLEELVDIVPRPPKNDPAA